MSHFRQEESCIDGNPYACPSFALARLDEDKDALPLTEIAAVFPNNGEAIGFPHQVKEYKIRSTSKTECTYSCCGSLDDDDNEGPSYRVWETRWINGKQKYRVLASCPTEAAAQAALRLMKL